MPSPRRLLAILHRTCGTEAIGNEAASMLANYLRTSFLQIGEVFYTELLTSAKVRSLERLKYFVDPIH